MAVDAAGPHPGSDPKPVTAGGLVTFIGAMISLALMIGVTVWAYKLITRDVSGVPVVRAAEGPMRVQPESPGGAVADHQGLSVNTVAAQGTASPPADRLILAPAPVDLSQDDVAAASEPAAEPVSEPVSESVSEPKPTRTSDAEAQDAPDAEPNALQLAAVEALANSLADGVDPISTQEVAPIETPEVTSTLPPDVDAPDLDAGLARSLRPKLRPDGLGGLPQAVSLQGGPVEDIDPDTLPVGTRLAQLGAFASADIARAEWDKLSDRFSDYLSGKSRVIQKATSGGRTFYRLRAAGFEDLSDARRFCSALVAERAECIPVVTR